MHQFWGFRAFQGYWRVWHGSFGNKKVSYWWVETIWWQNFFSEDPSKGSRDQKCTRMWWFEAFFHYFTLKTTLKRNFWNSFMYYPAESPTGDLNNNFKPYIKSLSPLVWILHCFEYTSATFQNAVSGLFWSCIGPRPKFWNDFAC